MADNVCERMRDTREGEGKREGKHPKRGGKPKLSPEKRKKIRQKRAVKRLFGIIVQAVCEVYGISIADITGESRVQDIAEARMVAMTIGYAYTGLTLAEIAAVFHRTRNAALNAVNRIADLADVDMGVIERGTRSHIHMEFLMTHPEYIRQDLVIL